jgi:predicted Zn-dependent protease
VDRDGALLRAVHGVEVLAGQARSGELADALAVTTLQRRHVFSGGQVRSGAVQEQTEGVLRLAAGGRDCHVACDGDGRAVAHHVVAAARAIVGHGRRYFDWPVPERERPWDATAHLDPDLAGSTQPLGDLYAALDRAAVELGDQCGVTLRLRDCVVSQQWTGTAFASSAGSAGRYGRDGCGLRVTFELSVAGEQATVSVEGHTTRVGDVAVAQLCREAAWHGHAGLAAASTEQPRGALLLTPGVSAALLRTVLRDHFERDTAVVTAAPAVSGDDRCTLVDTPDAAGGAHSRPFDDEGVPSRTRTLLDADGRWATLASRGSPAPAAGAAVLSGTSSRVASVVPAPYPSNVRLAGADLPLPEGYTGYLGYSVRGEGTQGMLAGEELTLRLDTAYLRAGVVVRRTAPTLLRLTGTELVGRFTGVTRPQYHRSWGSCSTAASWVSLALPD